MKIAILKLALSIINSFISTKIKDESLKQLASLLIIALEQLITDFINKKDEELIKLNLIKHNETVSGFLHRQHTVATETIN